MRLHSMVTPALVLAASTLAVPTFAQSTRIYSTPRAGVLRGGDDDQPRAVLGLTTSGSSSTRDTLGLLVTAVASKGPADRAGIEEGDRIASINGVSLRVAPGDADDSDVSGAMTRRLTRELARVRPGDEVDLRVYSSGSTHTVRVRTADSDSLYGRRRIARTDLEDRPTLGLGIASTGSRRDSLGVLVMFVDDSGPAGRAGIEEGNRLAEINGVDLRVGRDDSGDDFMGNVRVRRLQREVARLRPGDDVDLRVYANGRYHTVRLRAARAADLPRRSRTIMLNGDGMTMMPGMMPLNLDGLMMGDQVRRSLERAMQGAGRALEGVGRGLSRSFELQDDVDEDRAPRPRRVEPIEPVHVEPLEPSRLRRLAPAKAPYATALLREPGTDSDAMSVAMREKNKGAALDIAGLRMVPVGTELASYLGKGSERGLLVVAVPTWAQGAVRAGDVVLAVDGEPVRSDETSDEVRIALPRGRDAQLDILRDSVHHSVTLPARR
ncbi:MAG TPA: PDZ domain-containing protein [Gemmatimonadaceae bacterium]|nr:PDZ domain-containing protein [Gemmatimonadaceae bacterium]